MQLPDGLPFTIGVVSDEISPDPQVAAREAQRLGLTSVEVNSLWNRQVHQLSEDEVDRAARIFDDAGLPVLAVCPSLFKPVYLPMNASEFKGHEEFQEHLRILDRALELTTRFRGPGGGGVPFVRTFSFRKTGMIGLGNSTPRLPNGGPIDETTLDLIAEGLGRAAERAAKRGTTLVLENVRSCWGNSGTNAARIIERINASSLKALWDPANAYASGETFPTGWKAVRRHVAHVHLKDASVVEPETGLTRWECIGRGQAHLIEELRALWSMPYRGAVHVETHWKPDDRSNGTAASVCGLLELLGRISGEPVQE